PGEKVYLLYFRGTRVIDSTTVQLGTFTFKGPADISKEPEENYQQAAGRLFVAHTPEGINFDVVNGHTFWDMRTVYLEPGLTEVNMVDSARNAMVKGSSASLAHYSLDSIY